MPNPIALITGAARGLGLEVARQLATAGADVLITARDPQVAQSAAKGIANVTALPLGLDVADPASVSAVATAIGESPARLDILINDAAAYVDWTETPPPRTSSGLPLFCG